MGKMMERKAMAALEAWRTSDGRKPMVISGLRQTGKTWLVEEFGKTRYEDCITVNLESPRFRGAFSDPTDPERIVSSLSALTGKRITPDTLIFLDEVQDCPEALPSLKYFCEKAPEYHVIAAGSLLGISVSQGRKYTVGKVDELEILPMSFSEFVRACGNTPLADAIDEVEDGGAVALLDDLTLSETIVICRDAAGAKAFTLDLGGHTLSASGKSIFHIYHANVTVSTFSK